ncbi:sialoadhesin-like [Boleophthalmus pectinirostris]|uniref:sialoadhesin-like n=1 Tax=Boleophthalmus pectinirostris TaxID=150288 RepID=UPI00242BD47A|nr:sialoadhesin-like [Boleophthalmus pectinirostris]
MIQIVRGAQTDDTILPSANMFNQFILILLVLLCSGGAECCGLSSNLSITTTSTSTYNSKLEALRGSCLQIPCTYSPSSSQMNSTWIKQAIVGIWLKNSYKVSVPNVFSVSGVDSLSYPMNITGRLENNSCNTVFYDLKKEHEGDYYFRVVSRDFSATAVCDPLHITVRDTPWSPTLKVCGEQRETEVVTITCSAVTPCPLHFPRLKWNLWPNRERTVVTDHKIVTDAQGTYNTTITRNVTLTEAHRGLLIWCRASSYIVNDGLITSHTSMILNVSRESTTLIILPCYLVI